MKQSEFKQVAASKAECPKNLQKRLHPAVLADAQQPPAARIGKAGAGEPLEPLADGQPLRKRPERKSGGCQQNTQPTLLKKLPELYRKRLNNSIVRMGARDILTFPGKVFDGRVKG